MSQKTLYLSFDIEADGDAPSVSNMLSLGIYGFDSTGKKVDEFQRNIAPHATKKPDKRCMTEFWAKNPEAWAFVQTDQVTAEECMKQLAEWYTNLATTFSKIKWVARPAAYDWQWLNNYYHEFGPKDKPSIGFKATCISTMWEVYKSLYELTKEKENKVWNHMTKGLKLTHNPLDDAKYQAQLFLNLCKTCNMKI
jgi:hypothetical protein